MPGSSICRRKLLSDKGQAELLDADEIWMTSSTREIAPVIRLNAATVGSGQAGEMWKRVVDLYQQYKQQLRQGG